MSHEQTSLAAVRAGFTRDGTYYQPGFLNMQSPWLTAIKEVRSPPVIYCPRALTLTLAR